MDNIFAIHKGNAIVNENVKWSDNVSLLSKITSSVLTASKTTKLSPSIHGPIANSAALEAWQHGGRSTCQC